MKDREMLGFIYKNAMMGVVGINAVEKYATSRNLRKELRVQRHEYYNICRSAREMENERGERVQGPGTMATKSAQMMSKVKLSLDPTDAKIAEMMINGSAMGVTKIIRNKNRYEGTDGSIIDLSDKLLATEQNNIEHMKGFL